MTSANTSQEYRPPHCSYSFSKQSDNQDFLFVTWRATGPASDMQGLVDGCLLPSITFFFYKSQVGHVLGARPQALPFVMCARSIASMCVFYVNVCVVCKRTIIVNILSENTICLYSFNRTRCQQTDHRTKGCDWSSELEFAGSFNLR